jgi:hypothetical protein
MEKSMKFPIAIVSRLGTRVIVVGDDDMPHVLPLLTMTGVNYLKKN